jgi:hypothetical protein
MKEISLNLKIRSSLFHKKMNVKANRESWVLSGKRNNKSLVSGQLTQRDKAFTSSTIKYPSSAP